MEHQVGTAAERKKKMPPPLIRFRPRRSVNFRRGNVQPTHADRPTPVNVQAISLRNATLFSSNTSAVWTQKIKGDKARCKTSSHQAIAVWIPRAGLVAVCPWA